MHNPDVPYLLIPSRSPERVEFTAPVLSIGRSGHTDVKLDDDKVSRRHCRFYRVGNTFWVQDWYSSGGITYNGKRVDGIQGLLAGEGVSHGVQVGDFAVHVECPAAFAGDPRSDLAEIEEWMDALENDYPDCQAAFAQWASAMRAKF